MYLIILKASCSLDVGESWIKAIGIYETMKVCRMHLTMRIKFCQLNNEQIDIASKIANPLCTARGLFLKNFAAVCSLEKHGQRSYIMINKSPYRPKGINNADMSAAQSCVSLFLLCLQNIGVHDATDKDLEAFCHMRGCYRYFSRTER